MGSQCGLTGKSLHRDCPPRNLMTAPLRSLAGKFRGPLHQIVWTKGLGQVGDGSAGEGAFHLRLVLLGGEHDYRNLGEARNLPPALEHLEAIKLRHPAIQHQEVRRFGLCHFEGLLAIACRLYEEPPLGEEEGKHPMNHPVIIGYQNMRLLP